MSLNYTQDERKLIEYYKNKLRNISMDTKKFEKIFKYLDTKKMIMLEIGSFAGSSATIFSSFFKTVYCVDPWLENYDDVKHDDSAGANMRLVEIAFDENISKLTNIHKLKMTSEEASKLFEDKSLDFVYIDGLHTVENVLKDLTLWYPKIKDGMYIGGHDWTWSEVQTAFKKFFNRTLPHEYIADEWIIKKV